MGHGKLYYLAALVIGIPLMFIAWEVLQTWPQLLAIFVMYGFLLLMCYSFLIRRRKETAYYNSKALKEPITQDSTPEQKLSYYVSLADEKMGKKPKYKPPKQSGSN